MQDHDGDGDRDSQQRVVEAQNEPPIEEELRATLLRILASDPDCPLPAHARERGTIDPALLWDLTGYLLLVVKTGSRTSVDPFRAYRVVFEELEYRMAVWELN